MIVKLKEEFLTGNYDGMTDQEVANAFNATIEYEADSLTSGQIYNAIAPAEFQALSDTERQYVRDIFSLGTVNIQTGTNARTILLAIFGAGTATRTALATAIRLETTKAKQLGINIPVMDYHVTEARNG